MHDISPAAVGVPWSLEKIQMDRNRKRALNEINAVLDETETYTVRLIWGRSPEMERDLAQARARDLVEAARWMEFDHRPARDIWRTAVHACGLATIAQDRVLAQNAREIADRYAPRKRYSLTERRAIHRKALALLARKGR